MTARASAKVRKLSESSRRGAAMRRLVLIATLLVATNPQLCQASPERARQITVRIESSTEGSGVLIKNDEGTYTALTAWHVVSAIKPGEEADLITDDGQRHKIQIDSIERIRDVDMATLNFKSNKKYQIATLGSTKKIKAGDNIYVSGFALPSSSVPEKILRTLTGRVSTNRSSPFVGPALPLFWATWSTKMVYQAIPETLWQ